MGHELSFNAVTGNAELALAGRRGTLVPAWHKLGVLFTDGMTCTEGMEAANMGWDTLLLPCTATTPDGRTIEVPGMRVTARGDTLAPLGVVSDSYPVLHNRQAFDFVESLWQDGVIKLESCGLLKGGKIAWVLARYPSRVYIAGSDALDHFILFSTTHDGSGSIKIGDTATRVVCANTHRIATREISGIRHSGDLAAKLAIAHQHMSQMDERFTAYAARANKLAEIRPPSSQVDAYFTALFPPVSRDASKRGNTIREEKVSVIRLNMTNDRQTLPGIEGTWWAWVNATTEYLDHQVTYKGANDRIKRENRMLSTLDGDRAADKDKAFRVACELAGV